jgi:hypothetical protein
MTGSILHAAHLVVLSHSLELFYKRQANVINLFKRESLSPTFRYLLFAFGVLISLPLLAFVLLLPGTPVSLVGIIYLTSYALIILGMIFAPWQSHRASACILAGITITLLTLAIRITFPPSGKQMNMISLPSRSGPRLLNRIFNEQDVVLFGAQVAPYVGAVSSREKESLNLKFSEAFHEMNAQGVTSLSPFLTTYLGQQKPNSFDAIIAEPTTGTQSKNSIIFLHGFGGNFTLQCWLVATPANQIDAVTVCPSTGPSGSWWNSQGQSILEQTIVYLHQRGMERIYLAGLSNGAIGASVLAEEFEQDIKGLILISGADPGATITELPVLVVHGKYDERIPVSVMEQYVYAAGPHATYHLFEGDHFLLLKQAEQVQAVIAIWLREQISNAK